MMGEELAVQVQEVRDKAERNEARIKKLEESTSTLHELATSVAVMANQLKTINGSLATMQGDVAEMKNKPAKRWDAIVDKILWAVLAAVIAFLLGRLGL